MTRLERLLANLGCPACRTPLRLDARRVKCPTCVLEAEIRGEKVIFGRAEAGEEPGDWLLRVKERVKSRWPRLYGWLIGAVSPVFAPGLTDTFVRGLDPDVDFVIDYGSGPLRLAPAIVNVDITPYAEVDLVVPGAPVPLRDECADAIVSVAVLEHVSDPALVVADLRRLLKPGGRVFVFVPFMQGVHAAPDDFTRWTPHGLENLFQDFVDRSVTVGAGPASALTWIVQECFAMTFSFGSVTLYRLLYALGFAFAPLKLLDAFLRRHPMAANVASGFVITARKPS